jgi:hypothetical protein
MKTKYFLLGYGMNGENTYKLIDNLREDNIKKANKEFRKRNDFDELFKNYELVISKLEEMCK